MAVELFEGFDTMTADQVHRRYSNANISPGSGFASMGTGVGGFGQAFSISITGAYVNVPVTSRSEYYVGVDLQVGAMNGSPLVSILNTSGTLIGSIAFNGNALVTTWGNSSPGLVLVNTWAAIQFHIVISATVGSFTALIDGVPVVTATGLNTGSVNIGYFQLQGANSVNVFDDFYVMNTTGSHSNGFATGRMRVQALYPTSDGTHSDFTPNSGSTHYNRVNQAQADDDTTYNSDTTAGDMDTYHCGSLTGTISQVHSVMVSAVMKKDDIPPKTAHVLALSSSTLTESPDIAVPINYTSQTMILNDDPNTSAQWTTTAVNALEIGVKVVA